MNVQKVGLLAAFLRSFLSLHRVGFPKKANLIFKTQIMARKQPEMHHYHTLSGLG